MNEYRILKSPSGESYRVQIYVPTFLSCLLNSLFNTPLKYHWIWYKNKDFNDTFVSEKVARAFAEAKIKNLKQKDLDKDLKKWKDINNK